MLESRTTRRGGLSFGQTEAWRGVRLHERLTMCTLLLRAGLFAPEDGSTSRRVAAVAPA